MSYRVGQMVTLTTRLKGSGTPPAMAVAVIAPDGTIVDPAPTLTRADIPDGWEWTGTVLANQAGDWLYVFTASGSYVGVDDGQFHVIASTLRIVGLAEVKEHGNITSTANDLELIDFIGTAQQMIEQEVGPVVPATVTAERHNSGGREVWLRRWPVLSVTSVAEYAGSTLIGTLGVDDWRLDGGGRIYRLNGSGTVTRFLGSDLLVTYRVGRQPIPEGIRWAGKELAVHLWKSTQAQRGGRGRGRADELGELPAGFGLPNRVAEALIPFRRGPLVA